MTSSIATRTAANTLDERRSRIRRNSIPDSCSLDDNNTTITTTTGTGTTKRNSMSRYHNDDILNGMLSPPPGPPRAALTPRGMRKFLSPQSGGSSGNNKSKEMPFDSLHSIHTSSTASSTHVSPGSLWDDDDDSFCGGDESFSCLGVDEVDEVAEQEMRNAMAKQALESMRSRRDTAARGVAGVYPPKRMSKEISFRGTLELIEE